ncbi:MAG: hypothetical protein AB1490_07420 [Pseudomonadota bacterium]
MSVPPKYGLQTFIGAGVILMGLGFVGVQWLAPPASTANSTQAVSTRPTPRIIEINTKREDLKQSEPVKPLEQAAAPAAPAPQSSELATPPVSAAELKRQAQEETGSQIADDIAEMPSQAASEPHRKSQSRGRYPRYDRHAVY